MVSVRDDDLKDQVRRARGKFIAMATSYSLGVFNDNFFRQATLLLAVGAGVKWYQGAAMALFSLPYLLFAALAGCMADRFSKRRVVIGAKGLEVAAMVCGAVAICTGNPYLMLAIVFLMGFQSAIFGPSINGSIPELYPPEYVTRANARLKAATTSAILLGVALAGFLLDFDKVIWGGMHGGRALVAAVAVVIGVVGFAGSFGVPRRPAADPKAKLPWTGPLNTVGELWRIRKDRLLAVVIGTQTFVFFVGSVQMLLINELGLHQYGLSKRLTSSLIFVELFGIAVGGMVSPLLSRGRAWYRVFGPAALGLTLTMACVALVPALPDAAELATLYVLLGMAGFLGGIMLIPSEAFIQVRPDPHRRGAVIAAANFAVFVGLFLSGFVAAGLLKLFVRPTTAFGALAVMGLIAGIGLVMLLPAGPGNLLEILLIGFARLCFRLRYRIKVSGLDAIAERGDERILFLPNHPALIDPPILLSVLFLRFGPRAWGDADQIDRPIIRHLARRLGVMPIPDVARYGAATREAIDRTLAASVKLLAEGECVLLYPSGHIYRSRLESLKGTTAARSILRARPKTRVVLVRTRGLWGSGFSWASGAAPSVGGTLKRGIVNLLLSGIFWMPKRRVTIELFEPEDLPRDADTAEFNEWLERFYNEDAPYNTYVPRSIWERGGVREMPEPFLSVHAGDLSAVPEATRGIVTDHLRDAAGVAGIEDEARLGRDLGMDSLARVELVAWLEQEFGFPQSGADTLQTVADVLLAACGQSPATEPAELKPVPAAWFRRRAGGDRRYTEEGRTIPAAFLNAARRNPGMAVIADQRSGVKTYRDIITSVMALRPEIEKLPQERVGIMLPASVAANIVYLTSLFAGKTPVMVNWTAGRRNVMHSLDLAEVRHVLTARALVDRIASQGHDLSALKDRFVFLEEMGRRIPFMRKLGAAIRARVSWRSLARARVSETAAILFTSGSESFPKAVPLTHENILSDARGVISMFAVYPTDSMIGMLPAFHSFGLTVTFVIPVCTRFPVVYHPDPNEAGMLARLIEAYGVTVMVGTPTFLNNIVRASTNERTASLRIAVTGAEKCPARIYEAVAERCPKAVILEGYGVTECSPIISVSDETAPKRGAIGKPLPCIEHAIVDVDTGQRVGPGARGMLLVRGPSVFSGYLGYDGPSPFVECDGKRWYRTGDLVAEDDDGVLTFCGRLKRFAKLGGEMISLPAIESVLAVRWPAEVEEGPAVAVEVNPEQENPEIVLFTTREITREEANAHIRAAGLSPLHNIRRVIRVGEIPLLGTGKTDYRELRERLKSEG